ncbi:protein N-lysine methyltransferase family protein [Gemmata sp. JC673]|uniref:Protein N-lysine methyltransferase family protein n=1 Tax=Gemmata algarum TaxID=2975278 RepID=A0ABU5F9U4_9BACT|nr:methyltransferase domain-containing protein [Gemmata algarum]MDY3563547.1 protein N-lysine methyltransferase family protein [Gemmata algarum]
MSRPTHAPVLNTTAGDFPLAECKLDVGGRQWALLHAAAIMDRDTEDRFVTDPDNPLPYGAVLWPASIALAHEIAVREAEFRGRSVLELGAGTGLPGIVAASLGARVVQTDRNELAIHLCQTNCARNQVTGVEHREADWTEWTDTTRYDWIIGSDVLYAHTLHDELRFIFRTNLAPGGRVLLADPYRNVSRHLLEEMVEAGWRAAHARWSIGETGAPRPVAVYEMSPPVA